MLQMNISLMSLSHTLISYPHFVTFRFAFETLSKFFSVKYLFDISKIVDCTQKRWIFVRVNHFLHSLNSSQRLTLQHNRVLSVEQLFFL